MSNNFDLFENALQKCNINKHNLDGVKSCNNMCQHINIDNQNNLSVCVDCGMEITRNIVFNKEWRYYGASDTRFHSDPNRCQVRKVGDRSIFKDVENMGFSDKIITIADQLYQEVTDGKVFRGNSRKAIVFACIFHAYKREGKPQSCEQLINIFNLDRKIGLKGLKHVNLNSKKNVKITYITPQNLIKEIMKKFDATSEQIDEVNHLYSKIHNKSSILNRSRPQSVASGLVRYYILLKGKDITMKEFRQKVKLSELTIEKMAKEISKVLKTPWIIK
jgi:transcription initiation factor TFIIIB Brf1 subunit/transcription initiation factor TFIIB